MQSPAFDLKEQIRQSVDIVDLIGGYLQLRRQGRNFVALCPWHDDTRPSMQINAERQSWKCWVCDIGGDVFSFMMQREGVDFREAMQLLAERAGIEMQSEHRAPVAPGSPEDKRTLYQAMAWVEQQMHRFLMQAPEAEEARRYLDDRGISEESIQQFHIGYSPDKWQWILEQSKDTPFSGPVLEAIGVAAKSPKSGRLYDRFKGRVMFPIRDTQNRPIACGGRILPSLADDRAAKYINSPETRLFSKSDQLYGLDRVRDVVARTRSIVVMEGYTDVVVAQQMGVDDCVAVLGTALGQRHIRLLRRFVDRITLVLDGDEAGQRRTNEILELFVAEQVDLRILTLPDGLDPCDYVLDNGAEAFRTLLEGAVDALDHKVRIATAGIDLQNDTHRANQALEDILSTLAKAPRLRPGTDTAMRLREQQILGRLARIFQISEVEVRTRLTELRRKVSAPPSYTPEYDGEPDGEVERPRAHFNPRDRELLEIFTQHPEAVPLAMQAIMATQISEGVARKFFNAFCELVDEGHRAEFSRVLGRIDDPWLKNLLVEIDEQAAAKAVEKWEVQLTNLIKSFQLFEEQKERKRDVAGINDDSEGLSTLVKIREDIRKGQGISEPTDG